VGCHFHLFEQVIERAGARTNGLPQLNDLLAGSAQLIGKVQTGENRSASCIEIAGLARYGGHQIVHILR